MTEWLWVNWSRNPSLPRVIFLRSFQDIRGFSESTKSIANIYCRLLQLLLTLFQCSFLCLFLVAGKMFSSMRTGAGKKLKKGKLFVFQISKGDFEREEPCKYKITWVFAGNLFVAAEDDFLESLLEVVIECDVDHWVDHRVAVGEHVEPEPILLHQAGKLESLFISLLWRNLRQFNFQRKESLHYFAILIWKVRIARLSAICGKNRILGSVQTFDSVKKIA